MSADLSNLPTCLTGWLGGCLAGWLTGCLAGWLAGWNRDIEDGIGTGKWWLVVCIYAHTHTHKHMHRYTRQYTHPISPHLHPPSLQPNRKNCLLYRKATLVYAFRSKDPIIVNKTWGTGYAHITSLFRHFFTTIFFALLFSSPFIHCHFFPPPSPSAKVNPMTG